MTERSYFEVIDEQTGRALMLGWLLVRSDPIRRVIRRTKPQESVHYELVSDDSGEFEA